MINYFANFEQGKLLTSSLIVHIMCQVKPFFLIFFYKNV